MGNQLQKRIKWFSILVLGFSALSFHTYKTQLNSNSKSEGFYNSIINILTYFPRNLSELISKDNLASRSDVYIKSDPSFKPVNKLKSDLFLLGGNWQEDKQEWAVELRNLKSNQLIKSWQIKEEHYNAEKSPRLYPNAEVGNPILLMDSSLIVGQIGSFNLFKINKHSQVIWANHDYYIHHAMNLDKQGNVWICARKEKAQALLGNHKYSAPYMDDLLVLINQKDGSVLFEKSVIELLKENDLSSFAFGMNGTINGVASKYDPIHLNDIEPVFQTGVYQKKGDVWLSLRNSSTILLYRPTENKVVKVINGNLIHQHDVDVINDSTISVFNNNAITCIEENLNPKARVDSLPTSEVVFIDLRTERFKSVAVKNIYTATEGLCEQIDNDYWFVEEQNAGKIHVYQLGDLVYSSYYQLEGEYAELPHWSRVYKDLNFLND